MSALALTYFFTGAPCIYYGTENAMEGGYDPDCRRTFDWSLENCDNAVKTLVKTLASLKREAAFRDAEADIRSVRGLLEVGRGGYRLAINESGKSAPFAEVDAVAGNLYGEGVLKSGGFVVYKV